MNVFRKAAILLPEAGPGSDAATLSAQYVACQLYAANNDLNVVGRIQTASDATSTGIPPHHELAVIGRDDFEVVLAVNPDRSRSLSSQFVAAVEQLRAEGCDVLVVDEWKQNRGPMRLVPAERGEVSR
ncbi:MAG TPA: hypothetical protein VGZ32_03410 [Actinocrinis sp.]|jgi:hypothetical protein|uniref:hypothetical protein n=1 Tax=Actinocrinis sp. TaxID=1920516 RepID=UPI002DDCA3D0|nr:hypothetical protein [Actinocrinis sp.]HEV3169354.1 hypothetical protein [Actinocrinis sp.]